MAIGCQRSASRFCGCLKVLVLSMAIVTIVSDLSKQITKNNNQNQNEVWASWIGEVPTAAELYGDSSDSVSAFEDDDDDEDNLDSAASNEYPDEADQDHDQEQGQESRRQEERVLRTGSGQQPATEESKRKPVWGDLDGWRRSKREVEVSLRLASQRRAARARQANNPEEEFAVDDGDEDAWVHDGIDDIHIDPETKKAASEMSQSWSDDNSNIDSEYEPNSNNQLVNRTRVTTISEVIPVQAPPGDSGDDSSDSTTLRSHYVRPQYLPAALLTLDQARQLVERQHHQHPPLSSGGAPVATTTTTRGGETRSPDNRWRR